MEKLKEVKFIAIHHSGSLGSFEEIKNFHINTRGWEDIGYHWVIDEDGNLIKGRSEEFIGAHAYGHNRDSIAVCLIGDFLFEEPTEKQIQALIIFLKNKIKEYNILPENIVGHRELSEKEDVCPGRFFDIEEVKSGLIES